MHTNPAGQRSGSSNPHLHVINRDKRYYLLIVPNETFETNIWRLHGDESAQLRINKSKWTTMTTILLTACCRDGFKRQHTATELTRDRCSQLDRWYSCRVPRRADMCLHLSCKIVLCKVRQLHRRKGCYGHRQDRMTYLDNTPLGPCSPLRGSSALGGRSPRPTEWDRNSR